MIRLRSRQLDKPHKVHNEDETGLTIESKTGVVVGPTRQRCTYHIPHLSDGSTKQRMPVMYCDSAERVVLPPFYVYPEPNCKLTAHDLL